MVRVDGQLQKRSFLAACPTTLLNVSLDNLTSVFYFPLAQFERTLIFFPLMLIKAYREGVVLLKLFYI